MATVTVNTANGYPNLGESVLLSDGGGAQSDNPTASDRFRVSELWDVQKTNSGVLIENRVRPLSVHLDSTATWVLIHNEAG
jgi:hypothetical protein